MIGRSRFGGKGTETFTWMDKDEYYPSLKPQLYISMSVGSTCYTIELRLVMGDDSVY